MRARRIGVSSVLILALGSTGALLAQRGYPGGKVRPQKSGFYDFSKGSPDFPSGVGSIQNITCTVGESTQPSIYAGNMLLDCDAETPHNETTVAADPNNPSHIIGGYHAYQLHFNGATLVERIVGTVSVSFDRGQNWREVLPPITPYQFTGDPALAFNTAGRIYFANIADHEGPGGNFTGPSVVVAHSDDGGLNWSHPVTVFSGFTAITAGKVFGPNIFNDKEYIAVDTGATSAHRDRVYATWSKFTELATPQVSFLSVPIQVSFSDDGLNWSSAKEISGFGSFCTATISGQPNQCDLNQDSYPAVASNGKVYVSFENFNTLAENQVLVVSSSNGGATWSNPARVDTLFDINYPTNADGRATLTGCQLRYGVKANTATDPSDPAGNTVYVAWADNRNGTGQATNTDVFLGRSTDGGQTWRVHTVDNSSNDQFYPWVAVASDGRVDIGYMDRSYSAGQTECKYGFTLTRLTFDSAGNISTQTRQRVDTGLSDSGHARWFSGTTNGNSRFIGDYNGMAIGSDGFTWTLWTDQRNVVANPPSPTRNHGQHAVGTLTSP